jgi:hypothetical protein
MENNNYEIFSSSSLPINGWLQSCIYCRTFTSKIFKINYDSKELLIYLCNTCKNRKNYLKNNFKNRVKLKYNYIKKSISLKNNKNNDKSYASTSDSDYSSDYTSDSDNSSNNDFFDNEEDLPHYLKKKWIIDKIKKD